MVKAIPKVIDVFVEISSQLDLELKGELVESETPDQNEWRCKVSDQFAKIRQVLQGEAGESDEWESARKWANIYLSLFVLIQQGFRHIKCSPLGERLDLNTLTSSKLAAEIIKGHSLFWLSRAYQGYWTFPVKAIRDGLRQVKKLETADRLDLASYQKQEDQVLAHVENRIGDSIVFFAPHILCLTILRDAAKKDQQLKIWLNTYDQMMDQAVKDSLNTLRQGNAKGFGFSKGAFLEAKTGGVYKPRP